MRRKGRAKGGEEIRSRRVSSSELTSSLLPHILSLWPVVSFRSGPPFIERKRKVDEERVERKQRAGDECIDQFGGFRKSLLAFRRAAHLRFSSSGVCSSNPAAALSVLNLPSSIGLSPSAFSTEREEVKSAL